MLQLVHLLILLGKLVILEHVGHLRLLGGCLLGCLLLCLLCVHLLLLRLRLLSELVLLLLHLVVL